MNPVQLDRVDLNLLVLFEAVYETRHVGRAAQRLNLTASAVSHGLRRLREMLGDPLFLRTPKGVAATARADELAVPITDVLARLRGVLASVEPFDPATASRRFVIGAPDGAIAVLVLPLLTATRRDAPGIDLSLMQVLPPSGSVDLEAAWTPMLIGLESRSFDLALLPLAKVPARFAARTIYEDEFVVAMRKGHPFARAATLEAFCAMDHLLVSQTGDAHGFVDALLAQKGLARRVVLTVPNFMMALALIAESDLIAALPRRLVASQSKRFGLSSAPLPLKRAPDAIRAVVTKAGLQDPGVAWLFERITRLRISR